MSSAFVPETLSADIASASALMRRVATVGATRSSTLSELQKAESAVRKLMTEELRQIRDNLRRMIKEAQSQHVGR